MKKVLVIDIGGSKVKLMVSDVTEVRKFPSGPKLTPQAMVKQVKATARGWKYDVISLGFPGPVLHGHPAEEPGNLGPGWVDFDYEKAFGKPVKIINDAALQSLASYRGGRMLFLGLGTGVGSTLIVDDIVIPLELGELRYKQRTSIFHMLSKEGLARMGRKRWERAVHEIVAVLRNALRTDDIVIGGGSAELLRSLPEGTRRGDNRHAFAGGCRLWHQTRKARPQESTWTIE